MASHEDLIELIHELNSELKQAVLKRAVDAGDVDAVENLIVVGVKLIDISYSDYYGGRRKTTGSKILEHAVKKGNVEIVKLLLDNRVSPNYSEVTYDDDEGISHSRSSPALSHAINNGNLEIATLLVERGADIDGETIYDTPLHLAISKGSLSIAEMLINAGADINGYTSCHDVSYLMEACSKKGNVEIVNLLIRNKADVNFADDYGRSAISCAVEVDDLQIVNALLRAGASPDRLVSNHDFSKKTLLHLAIENNSLEMIKLLLSAGANPNVFLEQETYENSETVIYLISPLYLATKNKNIAIMNELLRHKAMIIPEERFEGFVDKVFILDPLRYAKEMKQVESVSLFAFHRRRHFLSLRPRRL